MELVCRVVTIPVSVALAVTVAPATTAPLESVTIPEIPATTLAYDSALKAQMATIAIIANHTCPARPTPIFDHLRCRFRSPDFIADLRRVDVLLSAALF